MYKKQQAPSGIQYKLKEILLNKAVIIPLVYFQAYSFHIHKQLFFQRLGFGNDSDGEYKWIFYCQCFGLVGH